MRPTPPPSYREREMGWQVDWSLSLHLCFSLISGWSRGFPESEEAESSAGERRPDLHILGLVLFLSPWKLISTSTDAKELVISSLSLFLPSFTSQQSPSVCLRLSAALNWDRHETRSVRWLTDRQKTLSSSLFSSRLRFNSIWSVLFAWLFTTTKKWHRNFTYNNMQ